MNRYRVLGRIGDGAYGSVVLAIKLDSGEKVAIKKYLKYISIESSYYFFFKYLNSYL